MPQNTVMKRPAALTLKGGADDSEGPIGKHKAQGLMNKLKATAKKGRPYPLHNCGECKTDIERRRFFNKFEVDKECSFLTVQETNFMKQKEEAALVV